MSYTIQMSFWWLFISKNIDLNNSDNLFADDTYLPPILKWDPIISPCDLEYWCTLVAVTPEPIKTGKSTLLSTSAPYKNVILKINLKGWTGKFQKDKVNLKSWINLDVTYCIWEVLKAL